MRVSLLLLLLDSPAALALSVCCNCHCCTHPTQTACTFPRSPLSLSLSLSSIAAVTSSIGKYLQQFNCSQFLSFSYRSLTCVLFLRLCSRLFSHLLHSSLFVLLNLLVLVVLSYSLRSSSSAPFGCVPIECFRVYL